MAGGGRPEVIERWKQIAAKESDSRRRAAYRDFALVFAELIRELVNWQRGLEGWEMKESQYIKGWMEKGQREGESKALRYTLIELLESRFCLSVPEPVRLALEGTNDPDVLHRWYRAALNASSWGEFQNAMRQTN